MEPYIPSQFARQFGCDQLYVGNPNTSLAFMGSHIDGARTWQFFIADCTEARLCMQLRTPNLLMTLEFCQWYRTSNSMPTVLSINSFGVKLISQRLKRKVTKKGEGKRVVWVPGLPDFVATADSEALDAESPHFEGVTCTKVPPDAPGGVGTTPIKDVEVEEMEEENPDVHFK